MDNGSPPAEAAASAPLYRPTRLQIGLLMAIGLVALGCGLYVRYRLIEQAALGVACQTGAPSTECSVRSSAIILFEHWVFGATAVISALLNLFRPSAVLIAIALFAGGLGIVLYNVALSALALTLLVFSLARPVPGRD
jgi:hypothetical protein